VLKQRPQTLGVEGARTVLRTALFVAIIVLALPARADTPKLNPDVMLDVKCAAQGERSATVQQSNSQIDWFLSRVEVPAAISKEIDDLDNLAALTSILSHPWGAAHLFRGAAPLLKSQLASLLTETTRETRLKEAITAYGDSAAHGSSMGRQGRHTLAPTWRARPQDECARGEHDRATLRSVALGQSLDDARTIGNVAVLAHLLLAID
jgi:hypothetical protein